jgi:hypothetical protein
MHLFVDSKMIYIDRRRIHPVAVLTFLWYGVRLLYIIINRIASAAGTIRYSSHLQECLFVSDGRQTSMSFKCPLRTARYLLRVTYVRVYC